MKIADFSLQPARLKVGSLLSKAIFVLIILIGLVFYRNRGVNLLISNSLDIAASWNSEACQNFYSSFKKINGITSPTASGMLSPRALPTTIASEDRYFWGRHQAMNQFHKANEVFVSHKYKFAYVEVRKAASTTIRNFLASQFNADWNCSTSEYQQRYGESCYVFGNRCSSLCLSGEEIQQYFFFSFVRHPIDRFYSGYKEADFQEKNSTHMEDVLEQMVESGYYFDPHLETAAFSLSSPIILNDEYFRIPLDFIGKVESFTKDFQIVLSEIRRRNTQGIPNIDESMFDSRLNPGNELTASIRKLGNVITDKLIRAAYAQDFACFKY